MKTKKKSLFAWFGRTVAVGMVPLMLVACANNNSGDDDTIISQENGAPTLGGTIPKSGSSIGSGTDLTLSFSEKVDNVNTSTVILKTSSGTSIPVTISGSGNFWEVSPDTNLSAGSYVLYIGTGIVDTDGNAYAGTPSIDFTVGSSAVLPTDFTLTTSADSPTADDIYVDGDNRFVAEQNTLSANDDIDGGSGTDTLDYSSDGSMAVPESGFKVSNVEIFEITSDAIGGTTFDMTDVTGATHVTNKNSQYDLSVTGVGNMVELTLDDTSGGNTSLDYRAEAVSGSTDNQTIHLVDNVNNVGEAVGSLEIDASVEYLNIITSGKKSHLTAINTAGAAAETIYVSGTVDLEVTTALEDVTLVDATTFTGALTIKADSNGVAKDVVVIGGDGDDTVDFSDGWEVGDSFTGGAGTDTLGITYAVAQAASAGTTSGIEVLDITDNASSTGTIDMDNFAGIEKVILNKGLAGGATVVTIGDAVTGLEVEADLDTAASGSLVIDLKTDGTADELTVTLDNIDVGHTLAALTLDDAETVNLVVKDGASGATSGGLTIALLSIKDAAGSSLNISGDADLTITNVDDPTTAILANVNASGMTGDLTISGMNTAAAGATIVLGSGDDTLNMATNSGPDTITLGAGDDTITYSAIAQSTGIKSDRITDFVQGEDKFDLSALGVDGSSKFVGNADSDSEADTELNGTVGEVVFLTDEQVMIVDVDGSGDINDGDLRVEMPGITTFTVADMGYTIVGATITLTDSPATLNTTTNDNASGKTTADDDTITSTIENFVNSTINGGNGDDTVTVTDEIDTGDLTSLTAASATGASLTSIEHVVFSDVDTTIALGTLPTDLKTLTANGTDAALSATLSATDQKVYINATSTTNGSLIIAFDNNTISTGDGNDGVDNVTGLASIIDMGAGDDNITIAHSRALSASFDGGTGTDNMTIETGGAVTEDLGAASATGSFDNIEILHLFDSGQIQAITIAGCSSCDFTQIGFDNASDNVTLTATQASALTKVYSSADDNGTLVIEGTGSVDLTDATLTGNTKRGLETAAGGNTVTLSGADMEMFVNITGGAGTDTLILDLEGLTRGGASANPLAMTGNPTVTGFEALVVTDSSAYDNGTLQGFTVTDASGLTSINASAITTAMTIDMSGLTNANGDLTVTLGSGDDTLTNGIVAGVNDTIVDFGMGDVVLDNISMTASGSLTMKAAPTAGSTTTFTISQAAGGVRLPHDNVSFDFPTDVTSIVSTGVSGNTGQVIVTPITGSPATADNHSYILVDFDGNTVFSTGDIRVIIGGDNITNSDLEITAGNLKFDQ
jgi:hypothetical protein